MATRLSKNTFAKLFPAMKEDEPEASDMFAREKEFDFSQIDSSEYSESDPDRPAPSTPTTRSPGPFNLPTGAYSPAQPQQPVVAVDDEPRGADPMAIETLVKIGEESKAGRADTAKGLYWDRKLQDPGQAGAPTDFQGKATSLEGGTDSQGRPYQDPADQPPPAATAAQQASIDRMRPKSALEAAKERFLEVNGRKIVDKDKSMKGRLMEGIQNSVQGIAAAYKANPNAHWSSLLAGGAARGIVGGTIDRTLNERVNHEQELGEAKRSYDLANEVATEEEKLATSASTRATAAYKAATEREQMILDKLDDEKKNALAQLRDIDEIDPDSKDPRVRALVDDFAKKGVIVLKKAKGSKFNFNITPDGQLIVGDTTTGAYKKGQGNYSKPPTFSDKDFPDELFGLKNAKQIEDEALASIGKDFPNRRRIPQVEQQLLAMTGEDGAPLYRNEDGTLNEAKAVQDGAPGADKLYENQPDNYQQRLAQYRTKAAGSQAAIKTEVAKFRTAVSNQRPKADAQEVPAAKVTDLFKKILALPPKQRGPKLKLFYENLSNIRITG